MSSQDEESKDQIEEIGLSSKMLYEMLGVSTTASQSEIKKAYRRLALLKHPDKCPDDPHASDNFQKLSKAYQVLSDEKKRARYDQYGDDGENGGDVFKTDEWLEAYDFYRAAHPEVTKQDYKSFAERYYGSDEEAQDLIEFYESQKGNMTKLLEFIMCSRNEDLPRFINFFDQKIKDKLLKPTKLYEQTKSKVIMLPDEKAEAKEIKKQMKAKKESSMHDLEKMILAKRNTSFLEQLEKKYCNEDGGADEDEEGWIDDTKKRTKKSQTQKKRKL